MSEQLKAAVKAEAKSVEAKVLKALNDEEAWAKGNRGWLIACICLLVLGYALGKLV